MPDLSLPVAGDPRDGSEGGSTEVEIAAATVELYNELKGSETAAGLATLQAILDGTYAPIEDAALTGTPTAPTAAPGTDTTQVATTEFVKGAVDNATYAPLAATDTITLGAQSFAAATGSPSRSVTPTGVAPMWLFDAGVVESIVATVALPAYWLTYTATLRWTNAGAGAGDVVWYTQRGTAADGASVNVGGVDATVAATAAPAQWVRKDTVLFSGVAVPAAGRMAWLRLARLADQPGDTLNNDAGALEVVLTRVS